MSEHGQETTLADAVVRWDIESLATPCSGFNTWCLLLCRVNVGVAAVVQPEPHANNKAAKLEVHEAKVCTAGWRYLELLKKRNMREGKQHVGSRDHGNTPLLLSSLPANAMQIMQDHLRCMIRVIRGLVVNKLIVSALRAGQRAPDEAYTNHIAVYPRAGIHEYTGHIGTGLLSLLFSAVTRDDVDTLSAVLADKRVKALGRCEFSFNRGNCGYAYCDMSDEMTDDEDCAGVTLLQYAAEIGASGCAEVLLIGAL